MMRQRFCLVKDILALQEEGVQRLRRLLPAHHHPLEPFCLCVENDATCASLILAARKLNRLCLLVPAGRSKLIPRVTAETGTKGLICYKNGELVYDPIQDGSLSSSRARLRTGARFGAEDARIRWTESPALAQGGVCLLSSGSMGAPKLVASTWAAMDRQAQLSSQLLLSRHALTVMCPSSVGHAYAINALFMALKASKVHQTHLYLSKSTEDAIAFLEDEPELPTICFGTPAFYDDLLRMSEGQIHIHSAFSAGTTLQERVQRTFKDRFGITIQQNYGSTETGNVCSWGIPGDRITFGGEAAQEGEYRAGYVGVPWPGVSVKLQEVKEVERSPLRGSLSNSAEPVEGIVWVNTPWQALGYVENQRLVQLGLWHAMGDRARRIFDQRICEPGKEELDIHHVEILEKQNIARNRRQGLGVDGRVRRKIRLETLGGMEIEIDPTELEFKLSKAFPTAANTLVFADDVDCQKVRFKPHVSAIHTNYQLRVIVESTKEIEIEDISRWICKTLWVPSESVRVTSTPQLKRSAAGKLIYTLQDN